MKKILFIITFLSISLATLSCSEDEKNANSKFQGTWSGIYTGEDDNGTWEAEISSDGSINGTVTSTQFTDVVLDLNGKVNSQGVLNSTYGNMFFTGKFNGNLTGNNGSGVWTNEIQQMSGTWLGNKD